MHAEAIIAKFQARRDDLARLGVAHLSVFGSMARGTDTPSSDVDVLVEFDMPATFSRYMDVKFLLEELAGRRIDLVTNKALRPEMRERIAREAIRVA